MNKKENMIAALSGCSIPEKVPIWELEFHLWNHFSDKRFVVGKEFVKLSENEQQRAIIQNAEIMCEVGDMLDFAAVTIPPAYWESAPGCPAYFWLPEESRKQLLKQLRQIAGNQFFYIVHSDAIIGMPSAEDYMEFAYRLFDEPESIDGQVREKCEKVKPDVLRWRDLGADGFLSTADQADNNSPYFNPGQLDRFVFPYLKEWADTVRSCGGYSIMHTDGNIMPLLSGVADCGVNAMQALDPTAGIDLKTVKELVGDRLCLCGNLDCGIVLTAGADEVYRKAVETLTAGMPGGRYVFGASNVIEAAAAKENFEAMHQAWKDYGTYRKDN